jgi:hypothetical protein
MHKSLFLRIQQNHFQLFVVLFAFRSTRDHSRSIRPSEYMGIERAGIIVTF